MAKEARKIIGQMIGFCRDNLEMTIIIGVTIVALVFVVLIINSIVKNKRRAEQAEAELEKSNREKAKLLSKLSETKEAEARIQQQIDRIKFAKESQENCVQQIQPKGTKHMSGTTCIDSIVQELSNMSPEILKEVDVKIQGAEIRIKYSNGSELALNEENLEGKYAVNKADEPDIAKADIEGGLQKAVNESDESLKTAFGEQAAESTMKECETADEASHKVEPMRSKSVLKFGPDNINTSRSGHVFSEEELMAQIRD